MTEHAEAPPVVEVAAELDVPGETRRQARVFVTWFVCLAMAVILSSIVGAHVSLSDDGSSRAVVALADARARKFKVALVVGLVLPALLTVAIQRRYRRGGAHARGITVDVTADGELRVWGRGYGARVRLEGADVRERLVDVYAGRLGAWRQRRIRVRAAMVRGAASEIELATVATVADTDEGLRVEGGEGDCIELGRSDFELLRRRICAV